MAIELPDKTEYRVGVLSDTHGQVSKRVVQRLEHVDLIIHAGDIDRPDVLPLLRKLAPVVAVRGNMDAGKWAANLNETETLKVADIWIHILHDKSRLDLDPVSAGFGVVISGHTHRSELSKRNDTLYLNPGSASFPRNPASASMAIIRICGKNAEAGFVDLDLDRH